MAATDLRAARRYATALFGAAQRDSKLETVESDLDTVRDLMVRIPSLRQLWESPVMPAGRKRALVARVLEGSVDVLTLAFLRLLVDKRREDILDTVRDDLNRLADESRRLVRAEALFAVEPTPEEQSDLVRSLEQRTGEHVRLTVRIDPEILGGVVVRMHDTIIDGSVRGTIERMRERLLQEA
jgi:F-type H+-transporting ATPase subunit delta